jgi:superkiller protein 3
VVKVAVARLFESQNVTAARQNYQEALTLDPGYVPARVGLVRMLDREGKTDLALAEARKVAAESPGSGEAHSVLGGLLLRTRDYAEAARVLEIAGRLLPEDASVQAWLGTAYNSTDRRPEAAAAFGKAVQLAPANTDYRATWGLLLGTQGQYDEAIAQLKKVIDTPGYKGEAAWANLGFVYRTMKRNDEAIAAYQKATEVSPKSGQAWHGLARSLFNATRMDEAMAAYTKTMEFEPKLAGEAHLGLGWCYVFKGDLEQAKASLAKAQEAHADPRKVVQLKANIDQRGEGAQPGPGEETP